MVRPLTLLLAVAGGLVAAGCAGAQERQELRRVVGGLDSPVYVTAAPGEPGRLYVVEQEGRILVVERGKVRPEPFLDLRGRITSEGEQGLLGLAFPSDYPTSRFFVVNYTNAEGDTRVVRYRSDGRRAIRGAAKTLLAIDQPYANHNGGMVEFGPDGLLYVGMGDGGSGGDPENRAQNPRSLLGKILRLDARNPGSRPQIVALGARNPWRFSFDPDTGDLWVGDVGQSEIEEIDRIPSGTRGLVNLGWDVLEGRARFEDKEPGPGRLLGPVVQYTHDEGCSVTGGYVGRAGGPATLRGRYVYGDYCSGRVWSIPAGERDPAPRREPFTVDGLVSFGRDLAGRIYAVSHGGTVYRLV